MLSSDLYQQPIVIIGAGSIGERHTRNLWASGFHNIIVFRQRNLPFRDIGKAEVTVMLNWNEMIAYKPFAAIIATPTSQHLQQTLDCANAGMHVLVEKPLWHRLFDKENLVNIFQQQGLLLQVGYMLRYHPLLQKVKVFVEEKKYGNIINIQTYWGEYLPNWHPWEDYRQSYAGKKEFGGGPALTLSHDIDVVNWLMNSPIEKHQTLLNYASSLDVNTESAFDANLLYHNKATAHVHVNFCQQFAQRWYKIIFDEAVIDIDYFNATMSVANADGTHTEKLESFDRNDLFRYQLKDFFTRIQNGNYYQFTKEQIENAYNIIKTCNNE